MKQVNFSYSGGFPLEQETLERLQTAYRSELYAALKGHLSIEPGTNYTIAPATIKKTGWAIVHEADPKDPKNPDAVQKVQGILYPINKGEATNYLKTIRIGTNLVYGTGTSHTAYFDYEAQYISQTDYINRVGVDKNNDALTVNYYDLGTFTIVKDIAAIEAILKEIDQNIKAFKTEVANNFTTVNNTISQFKTDVANNFTTVNTTINTFKTEVGNNFNNVNNTINTFKTEVGNNFTTVNGVIDGIKTNVTNNTTLLNSINNSYFPFDGSRPITGNLTVGGKAQLNNVDTTESYSPLLVLNAQNQVAKNSTVIDWLIGRLNVLEARPASAVPIGMIAIWGKSDPFPEGWEEYVPLRGRMPIGLKTNDPTFSTLQGYGGNKNKTLLIEEIPSHYHHKPNSPFKSFVAGSGDLGGNTSTGTSTDGGDNSQMAIGELGTYYDSNGDALERAIGGDQPFSILNPYRVVQFIEYTGRSIDTIAPTPPTDLIARSIGRTYISFSWTPSYDERGIANYLIYQDDVLIDIIDNINSYVAGGLSRSKHYSFHVIARDAVGNLSAPSAILKEKTDIF